MSRLKSKDIEAMDLREVTLVIESTEELIRIYEQAVHDHRYNLTQLTYRRNRLRRLEEEGKAHD